MEEKVVTAACGVNRDDGAHAEPCYTARMLRKLAAVIVILACAALPAGCARAPSNDPDLILTGGVIYPLGAGDDQVEAVAIRGDSIVAMGTDTDVLQLAGPYTQQMPLDDSVVLPGGYDAWIDLEALGRWSTAGLDLSRASSIEEAQAMLRNAAGDSSSPDDWIIGWGWDQNDWSTPALPGAADLDAVGLLQPVALLHRSGLMAWANSAALQALTEASGDDAARRGAAGPDTDAGIISGARLRALERFYAGDEQERVAWLADGARLAAAAGITRVATSPLDLDAIELLLELEFRGLLPVRTDVRLRPDAAGALPASRLQGRLDDSELVRIVAVGVRLDGPLAAGLAALQAPYLTGGGSGVLSVDVDDLSEAQRIARSASLPLHLHASGDRAGALALETLGPEPPPNTMIVGLDLPPEGGLAPTAGIDIAIAAARFSRDIYSIDALLGSERARRAHAWRDILATGSTLRLASDAPAYPLRPLAAIAAAETRQDADGYPAGGWNNAQALRREDLLRALSGAPDGAGAGLRSGDAADLVVWSEDPVRGDSGALLRAEALLTIVAGRVAYSRALVQLPMETQPSR
jgi:predicted amidohydrolase YtcJ